MFLFTALDKHIDTHTYIHTQVNRCHTLLKKHAVLVRRLTQRLGLDRGVMFLEEEIRRLEAKEPSSLRVETSSSYQEEARPEQDEDREGNTSRFT